MANKESGEDILRAILEKGNKNVKDQVAKILGEETSTAIPPPVIKTRKRKLGEVVGKVGTSSFFRTPDGAIVDENGKPVSIGLAKAFAQYEPKAAAAVPAIEKKGTPVRTAERELRVSIQKTNTIIKAQQTINKKIPTVHDHLLKIVDKMSKQNEMIINSFIQQNQDFQDKVVESMTGVKAPTRAAGAKRKITKGVGSSRAAARIKLRDTDRGKFVRDRAERIGDIRMKRNIAIGAGAGILGAGAGILAAKGLSSLSTPAPEGAITQYSGLGSISQKYESGNKGVHTISSGQGDPGGVSYGSHQLATNTGTMARYLASDEGKKYASSFAGLQPGTEPFNNAYRQVASSDPQGFAASQKAYIARTHYDPVSKHAAESGFTVADPRIQEVLFSMGVQHGGAKLIVSRAGSPQGKSVEEQIKMLFEARKQYVAGLSMPEGTRQSLYRRYASEERDVLAMTESATGSAVAAAPQTSTVPGPSGSSAAAGAAASSGSPQQVAIPGPSGGSAAMGAAATVRQSTPGTPIGQAQTPQADGSSAGNVRLNNQGATRNKPVSPYLMNAISTAVKDVYGPGATAEIYSGGQDSTGGRRVGSTRHDNGMAADLYVYANGRRVTGDDLGRLAQYWLARRLGGVGLEMRGGGIHLDQHTNRHPYWFYGAGETAKARSMVMAGAQGQMPDAAGQTQIAQAPGAPAAPSSGGAPRQYSALGASSRAAEMRDMRDMYAAPRPIIIQNNIMNSQNINYRTNPTVGARSEQFNPLAVALGFGIGKALRLF